MLRRPLLLTMAIALSLSAIAASPARKVRKRVKKTVKTEARAPLELDSVFIYSPGEKDGLHIASNIDTVWHHHGKMMDSDYGPWGAEKRMHDPFVCFSGGKWYAVWNLNPTAPCFATAYSENLVFWRPQDYPYVKTRGVSDLRIRPEGDKLAVTYRGGDNKYYQMDFSKDFRRYSDPKVIAAPARPKMDTLVIDGKAYVGQKFKYDSLSVRNIADYFRQVDADNARAGEDMNRDKELLLPSLSLTGGQAHATISIDPKNKKQISDHLIGIFFEDISYAADGGLYAEMVENRDFEYSSADRREWNATTAWTSSEEIKTTKDSPLSANNPTSVILGQQKITNGGWDGFCFRKDARYIFSFFARNIDCKKKTFRVTLHKDDKVVAEAEVKTKGGGWQQYEVVLTASDDVKDGRLSLEAEGKGSAAVDMVSLFPEDTFNGRRNGLRKDLAETIAALHPKFMRFPGGCMSHGQGLDNIYHWKDAVGPLQDRKPDLNVWRYHQTRGLGFYEYFLFCEDIGAEPLPVLAAGVPCQNSAANADGYAGQQGGIPMSEMDAYCQELLDLIEWANGDPATSKWAKMRADAGHPAPFNLKYIGIGNEDIIGTVFEDRYEIIAKAIRQKYPDIIICGTVGPFHYPSSDYIEGWDFAVRHKDITDMVDEHYYESPGWYLNNQDYYDGYDRTAPKVYLGEYASRGRTVQNALVEAMHLIGCERNGDVVDMTSYAPLLARDRHHNWNPDLIYFGPDYVTLTPSYETQRLFSLYSGDRYLNTEVTADSLVEHRVAAGVVEHSKTGCRYLKIVNSLPVPLKVDVEGMPLRHQLRYEGFSGNPADKKEKNEIGEYADGDSIVLPPYSLRVIQLCDI